MTAVVPIASPDSEDDSHQTDYTGDANHHDVDRGQLLLRQALAFVQVVSGTTAQAAVWVRASVTTGQH